MKKRFFDFVLGVGFVIVSIKMYFTGWSSRDGVKIPPETAILIGLCGILIIVWDIIFKKKE